MQRAPRRAGLGIGQRVAGVSGAAGYGDLLGLRLGRLGDGHGQQPIAKAGADLLAVDILRQREGALKAPLRRSRIT